MSVKLRLQRHGRKGRPFYWIVAANTAAKRDGKYLEKIGTYNPIADPAIITLDVDAAVRWLQNGAQPTDTVRRILSYEGALLKHHLLGGVRKGALTEEQAEEKFQAWLEEKNAKKDAAKQTATEASAAAKAKALEEEKRLAAEKVAAAEAELKAAEEAAAAEAAANEEE